MNLGKQIDSLLKRNPSVYVKGLGVFQRIHTPATFDSKRNVFLPPISYVEFDHFETEGYDFLTYLQQIEHLERNEAEARLEETINIIVDKVLQDGEAELDNLGTLISYGHAYVFKPLDLSGFQYTAIENEYVPVDSIVANVEEELPIVEESVSAIVEPTIEEVEEPVVEIPIEVIEEEIEEPIEEESVEQIISEVDSVEEEAEVSEDVVEDNLVEELVQETKEEIISETETIEESVEEVPEIVEAKESLVEEFHEVSEEVVDTPSVEEVFIAAKKEVVVNEELATQKLIEDEEPVFGHFDPKTVEADKAAPVQSNPFGDLAMQYQAHVSQKRGSDTESRPKESNSYIYGLIAALVLMATAGIFYYAMVHKSSSSMDEFMENMKPVLDSAWNEVDTAKTVVAPDTLLDTPTVVVKKDTLADKVLLPPPVKESKVVNHKYIIVIGTHATLEQAEEDAKSYNQKGHKSVRVLPPNLAKNKKRVIWDTYPTREKRDSAMRVVREKYKADAWGTEIN